LLTKGDQSQPVLEEVLQWLHKHVGSTPPRAAERQD